MKRIVLLLSVIFLTMHSFSQVMPGGPAIDLSLPGVNGQPVTLSQFKGKIVLLDFWASWCGPCRHNNPRLVKLYKKFHPMGFEILGVSVDTDPRSWKEAITHDRLLWTQVIDDKGWDAQSTAAYGVNAIPSSFLIDQHGIVQVINGDEREIERAIKKLL